MQPQGPSEDFPVVIKGKIKEWKIVNYKKEDWCNVFRDKQLKFREGRRAYTSTPCWERLCGSKEMTLKEFFELSNKNSNHWLYFDYKYLRDVFSDDGTFIDEIKWCDLKLFGVDREESALWIGNADAHTPCHKDTYGCNVVAQLFGRKLWILMPPEESESLGAVRVPYEESSVYSVCNFFTPNNDLLKVQKAYRVVLSPGDVLYVPRHWWHYVENLEPAISINIWVPLAEDHESRLEESLVQHYVSSICQELTEEECKEILNPNEYGLISEPCTLATVEKCLENCKKHLKENDRNVWEIRNKLSGEMATLEKLEMQSYIDERCRIYNYSPFAEPKGGSEVSNRVLLAEALINAYCRPSNIAAVRSSLLNRCLIAGAEGVSTVREYKGNLK